MERRFDLGGRGLEVLLGGDPAGTALVMHHGTPSCGAAFADWSDDCAARGLRLIAPSRPGYAGSDRLPGRDVAAVAADVAAVLDGLGVREFLVAGWSGGGPHALACATLSGGRCGGAALLAGVGPSDAEDLDFLAGMGPENVAEFGAARTGEAALRAWLEQNAAPFRHVTGDGIVEAFGGLIPLVDQDALRHGHAEEMAAVTRRALATGFDGWIDDDLAFDRPWGFNPGAIDAPVTIWQGDLDLMVPPAHGAWLAAHVATARFRAAPGHGHISLLTRYRAEILDGLTGRT